MVGGKGDKGGATGLLARSPPQGFSIKYLRMPHATALLPLSTGKGTTVPMNRTFFIGTMGSLAPRIRP